MGKMVMPRTPVTGANDGGMASEIERLRGEFAAAIEQLQEADETMERLRNEVKRLISANEHWHIRLSQMVIQDKAALEKIARLESELENCNSGLESATRARDRYRQALADIVDDHSCRLCKEARRRGMLIICDEEGDNHDCHYVMARDALKGE